MWQLSLFLGSVLLLEAACVPAGGPASFSRQPSQQDNDVRARFRAEQRACNAEMRQMMANGASRQEVFAKQTECIKRTTAVNQQPGIERLSQASPVAGETLRLDLAARKALEGGRDEEAMAIYKRIDANGPAIIQEAVRLAPPGAEVGRENSQATNSNIMDMDGMLGELARAQRLIGESYENSGRDALAPPWYEKANATLAVRGGHDPRASTLLGFMYAHGRGVPKDSDRATAYFNEAESEFLPARGSHSNPLVYLLQSGRLPQHRWEVTTAMANEAQEQEAMNKLLGFLLTSAILSGGRTSQQNRQASGPSSLDCADYSFMGAGRMSALAGCGPTWW